MIPSLNKQFNSQKTRTLRKLPIQNFAEQSSAIPASQKMPDARQTLPFLVPTEAFSSFRPVNGLETVVASHPAKGVDRKLDPFPSGKSWYGNYTGPGNERRDWEEDGLKPQTPLDRAPMQHDQDYSNVEEKYGYGHYEIDPDGKQRFKGDEGSFLTMRFDTDHEALHISLIDADVRLMWRSVWYTGKGIGDGDYDLTFSKGPKGAQSLVTDVLVAGVILQVFPILIAMDVTFLGLTVGRHVVLEVGELVNDHLRSKPFPNATMSGMWMNIGGYRLSGEGKIFGVPYEIGMRNVTMADIYVTIASSILGVPLPASLAIGWVVHQWSVGHFDDRAKLFERKFRHAPGYYWEHIGGSPASYGDQMTGGARYYGGQISRGAKYYGGQLSRGSKSAGKKVSDISKQAGGAIARGAHGVGGKISDAWKDAGGGVSGAWKRATGGAGGGCFLTTACTESLAKTESQLILDTLRAFRDQVLLASNEGEELVHEYYTIAPQIVKEIDASQFVHQEYWQIYCGIVLPTFHCICNGNYIEAIQIYYYGVRKLFSKWCPGFDLPLISRNCD